jgi:hypothetical protein
MLVIQDHWRQAVSIATAKLGQSRYDATPLIPATTSGNSDTR